MSDDKFEGYCPKCKSEDVEQRDVDEVGGQAVGPYTVFECQNCEYDWYEE